MQTTINKFKAGIIENGMTKEPLFDMSIQFSCELKEDYFEISVSDIEESILSGLKEKYQWLSVETIDVPEVSII